MQDHLRYRQQFNTESLRFILYYMLGASLLLFSVRLTEAFAARDPVVVMPVSLIVSLTLVAFVLFRSGRMEASMTVLLAGGSLTMVAASYVFSFTASMPFWLVQAAFLVTAGGVLSIRKLVLAVLATLALVALSFSFQKFGLNMGRVYGPLVSEWLALIAVILLLGLSGVQSVRFATMFERTIQDLARSSERLSGLLAKQEETNRQLQEGDERYRLLADHTPVALARYDDNLRVTYSNPLLARLFGIHVDTVGTLTLDQLVNTGVQQVLRSALLGQSSQYEGAHVNQADGRNWWMALNCSPLLDDAGHIVGAIAAIRDDTTRRQRELELSRTQDIADQASHARSRFLSLMSHEVRTPMNDVYGYAQLLMDPRLPEDRRMSLKSNILASSKALMNLLDSIVDASKIEAGLLRLDEKRFEPAVVLHQTVEQFRAAASDKNLELECGWLGDDPGYLMGDAPRIRQMLGNLLSNAIKYTPSGFVQVAGEVLRRDDSTCALKFSVIDSGLGISPERQESLFTAHGDVSSGKTEQTSAVGAGMGLTIVRRLARLMNGEVGLVSEPGRGSTFWFIVNLRLDERDPWDDGSDEDDGDDTVTDVKPLGERQAELEAAAGSWARARSAATAPESGSELATGVSAAGQRKTIGTRAMNILLVEDNPTNAQLVQDMLELEGFNVVHALNGQEALDALYERKIDVDVVLMDCRMPVMDGYECTQRIRAHEAENPDEPKLPVIALTANVFEDDRNRCMQVGMDDFLRKPVDLAELVKTLRKHTA